VPPEVARPIRVTDAPIGIGSTAGDKRKGGDDTGRTPGNVSKQGRGGKTPRSG